MTCTLILLLALKYYLTCSVCTYTPVLKSTPDQHCRITVTVLLPFFLVRVDCIIVTVKTEISRGMPRVTFSHFSLQTFPFFSYSPWTKCLMCCWPITGREGSDTQGPDPPGTNSDSALCSLLLCPLSLLNWMGCCLWSLCTAETS